MSRPCLVMLRPPLVARDLALTLQDITGCAPVVAGTTDEACLKLAALRPPSLHFAFVQTDGASLRGSRLLAMIWQLGGRPVLVGHAAEMEAAGGAAATGWPVLAKPFGSTQVAQLLARYAQEMAQPQGQPRADCV
ncbi:MAG: hypothetical protein ACXIVG_17310 [Pararhodobacter sp.]